MKDRTLKGGFSIAFKLFFVLLFLILVLTGTTTFFVYVGSKEALREDMSSHLVDLATTTALMVDVDKHSQLDVGDENTGNYKEIRAVLQSVKAVNPKIDDIYTMVRSDEENIWLFVVDTHESKQIGAELTTTSHFYDPLMESALEHPVAGEEIMEWGSFKAMAPIYNSNGTAVAILDVDVCVEEEVEDFRAFRDYWLDLVKSTAQKIDGDNHSQLKIGDENSDTYREIKTILESVVAENPEIEDISTMVKSEDGAWFYIVDVYAMTPEIGEEYDVSPYPEMQLAFEGPIADEEITMDKWGVWLSAYAPIYDKRGTAVAILGIDMDVGHVLAAEKRLRSIIAIIFLGALLLSMIISILFARHFTRPIDQLKFGTSRVIRGDLSHRIESDRKDEFGELATAFNHMTVSLQEHIEKLKERTTEVEKLLRHKDDFITQLGHDLKTPLTPLVALLPTMEKREKDPELKELLEVTIHNVNYMKDLVIKTLQLARLTSPDVELIIEDINLLQKVNDVIKSEKFIFKKKDIKVENKINGKIIVTADKLRLEELFSNLITNAVKFTPDGGGTITIDAKKDEDFVTISVKDTGIGMTGKQLEHIFEAFYKVDESRHELDSSGLGLSICKRIVEKHGGKIWAESPGKGMGTTFYFTLKSG